VRYRGLRLDIGERCERLVGAGVVVVVVVVVVVIRPDLEINWQKWE